MTQADTVGLAEPPRAAADGLAATRPPPDRPAAAPVTVGAQFGEMVWLLSQSPLHRHLFVSDLEWMLMPPMLLGQHRLWRTPARVPAGFAAWAFLSEDVERRLAASMGPRLHPSEWRSGDRPWLIDLVAPRGGASEMLDELRRAVFAERPFAFHRTMPDGRRIVERG